MGTQLDLYDVAAQSPLAIVELEALEADKSPFLFRMGSTVDVYLSGKKYTGKIISRCESHTGGISYAVFSDYDHGKEGYWFSERDISPNAGHEATPVRAVASMNLLGAKGEDDGQHD